MKKTLKIIIISILTWEAKAILKRYKPRIIAITGSVGKTSTKDAVYTVLSHFYSVRKSEKSFNGEIGLPLTILGVPNGWDNYFVWIENILQGLFLIIFKSKSYPDWLVLEVGAGKPNDIKNTVSWITPDMVIMTRFPDVPVHVEFFKDTDHIVEEKTALALALKKDGVLVLNHDDKKVLAVHHKVKCKTVSYGFDEHATYKASYPQVANHAIGSANVTFGVTFKMEYEGNTFPVSMNHVIGMSHMYAGLAALAVAIENGCDTLEAINALAEYRTPPGRLSVIEGMNNSIIIDDTYNASPVATENALEVLDGMQGKRKIAVLGDMLELGKMTEEAHRNIGKKASQIADILVVVGPRSRFIANGAEDNGFPVKEIYAFDSSITAGKFLMAMIEAGDIVLIKGSQGIRMEKTVKMVMANPKDANKLLCRQEKEWEKR